MSSMEGVVEILDDEEDDLHVINICPDETAGDLAIMQQYYSLPAQNGSKSHKDNHSTKSASPPDISTKHSVTNHDINQNSQNNSDLHKRGSENTDNTVFGNKNQGNKKEAPSFHSAEIESMEFLVNSQKQTDHTKISNKDSHNTRRTGQSLFAEALQCMASKHSSNPADNISLTSESDPLDVSELETEIPKQNDTVKTMPRVHTERPNHDRNSSAIQQLQAQCSSAASLMPPPLYPIYTARDYAPYPVAMGQAGMMGQGPLGAARPLVPGHPRAMQPMLSLGVDFPMHGAPPLPPPPRLPPQRAVRPPVGPLPTRQMPPAVRPGFVCQVDPPADIAANSPVFGITHWLTDTSGQCKPMFMCNFCQVKTQDQESFLNHTLTHMFVCKACGAQAFSRLQLMNHTSREHPELHAQLGQFETMQVAKLSLKPKQIIQKPADKVPNGIVHPKPSPPADSACTGRQFDARKEIQKLEDDHYCCDVCKITTTNSDMVSWSGHLYLHEENSIVRIHCVYCGIYSSNPDDMVKHFSERHASKGTGVTYGVQAVLDDRLIYLWYCPQCQHSEQSLASMASHLQDRHGEASTADLLHLLDQDVRESMLQRSAGLPVNTNPGVQVPVLADWVSCSTDTPPSMATIMSLYTPPSHHSKSCLSESQPFIPASPTSNPEAHCSSRRRFDVRLMNDQFSSTKILQNLVVQARDHYLFKNGVFSCRACIYRTRQKYQVAEHLWAHIPGNKWACGYCGVEKKRRCNVLKHLRSKHQKLPQKVVIQVPTVIGFDNMPMKAERQSVARKSTASAQNSIMVEQPQSSPGEGRSSVSPAASSCSDLSQPSCPSRQDSNFGSSSQPSPLGSEVKPSSPSLLSLSSVDDDELSCWVCNVCHRRDQCRSLMRTHLMFAHPEHYMEDHLALSRVKTPGRDPADLVKEASCKKRRMSVSLLRVEQIYMYDHLRQVIAGDDHSSVSGHDDSPNPVLLLDSDTDLPNPKLLPDSHHATKSTAKRSTVPNLPPGSRLATKSTAKHSTVPNLPPGSRLATKSTAKPSGLSNLPPGSHFASKYTAKTSRPPGSHLATKSTAKPSALCKLPPRSHLATKSTAKTSNLPPGSSLTTKSTKKPSNLTPGSCLATKSTAKPSNITAGSRVATKSTTKSSAVRSLPGRSCLAATSTGNLSETLRSGYGSRTARKSLTSSSFVNSNSQSNEAAKPGSRVAKKSTSKCGSGAAKSNNANMLYSCFYCSMELENSSLARKHLVSTHICQDPRVINLKQRHNPGLCDIYLCTETGCSFSTFLERRFREHQAAYHTIFKST